jgi:hypothetical protein
VPTTASRSYEREASVASKPAGNVCLRQATPSSDTQTIVGVLLLIEVRPSPSARTWPLYGPAGTVDRLQTTLIGLPSPDGAHGAIDVYAAIEVVVAFVGGVIAAVEVVVAKSVGCGAEVTVLLDVVDTRAVDAGLVVIVAGPEAGATAVLDPHATRASDPQIAQRTAWPRDEVRRPVAVMSGSCGCQFGSP